MADSVREPAPAGAITVAIRAEPELGTEFRRKVEVTAAICANCGYLIWADDDFGVWTHTVTGDWRCRR